MSSIIILLFFFVLVVYFYNNNKGESIFDNDILIPIGAVYTESKEQPKNNNVTPSEARKIALDVMRKAEKDRSKAAEREAKVGVQYVEKLKSKVPAKSTTDPVFNDAILALTKLGFKKGQAKSIVTDIMAQGVTNLNEIVMRAFKK